MRINHMIFVLAMVVFFNAIFADAAEARKNRKQEKPCICLSAYGTMHQGCLKHGNDCIGQPQHHHENDPGRNRSIGIFCEYKGHGFVTTQYPTCKAAKKGIRAKVKAAKAQNKRRTPSFAENPLGYLSDVIGDRLDSNARRAENQVKRNTRDFGHRIADDIIPRNMFR